MSRPLVCLVEPCDNGHHPMYAAVYSQAVVQLGCEVWLIGPQGLFEAMPAPEDGSDSDRIRRVPWDSTVLLKASGMTGHQRVAALWASLGQCLEGASRSHGRYPDIMVHLYLDSFISEMFPRQVAEASIRCPFAGLWFKPSKPLTWSIRDVAKRAIRAGRRYRLLRSERLMALLLLDTVGQDHLAASGRPQLIAVPEFTTTALPSVESPLVARIRDRAAGRQIYSLVGSLEGRKGIKAFLRAAAGAPPDDWLFVMVGKAVPDTFDQETKDLLRNLSEGDAARVLVEDRWLDEAELNAVVAASGLLHVCYEEWPYSSNMLCKSTAYCVPAVGCEAGYIGRAICTYGLGVTVASGEELPGLFVPGFADQIASLRGSSPFRDGCRRYAEANNPTKLVEAMKPLMDCVRSSSHTPSRQEGHADD